MSSVSRLGLGLRLQPSSFGCAAAVPRRCISYSPNKRVKSTLEAGEDKSGHINQDQNQAVLFFDRKSTFSTSIRSVLQRDWMMKLFPGRVCLHVHQTVTSSSTLQYRVN